MNLSRLDFPEEITSILEKSGISELNPPQIAAIKSGLLENKNLVIAAPTASGKTLIAEIAFIKNFLNSGKTVYLVPLKALASEKYREFKEKYEKIGMRIAISIGDLDSDDAWLRSYDLIIASNEKMDSLLRHSPEWINRVSLIIADEIHLINDASRGPTLEVVLTRLHDIANAQILALSATIQNADEIAEWLDAKLVKSDYRPVKLHKGVFYPDGSDSKIEFLEKEKYILQADGENELILSADTLSRNKQALMFLSTRASAEAAAEKISRISEKFLSREEKEKLAELSNEALNALGNPTKQCKRLASLLKSGVAFHHAGLVAKQRQIIEDNFRNGLIKILTATPTLAFGLNLPAWRVLIRDTKRYGGYGADYIPVLEIHQMQGRAGRPKYDTDGEAILMAKTKAETKELWERYILGEPEPIYSKLSLESVLRMHVLSLVSCEAARTLQHLQDFFSKTFFAHQYKDIDEVMEKVGKILKELESYNFIRIENGNFISNEFVPAFDIGKDIKLEATRLGKRVSELYLDPQSAHRLIENLKVQPDMNYLLAASQCMEMRPLSAVKQKETEWVEEALESSGLVGPDVWDIDYEDFLKSFKASLMFTDWMSETGEDKLLEKYGITPGELYAKTTTAEWIFYAMAELAKLLNKRLPANAASKIKLRIRYGVKEELLPLVRLRSIGRIRARLLFRNGIKNISDIKKAQLEKLEAILGRNVAKQLKETTEENLDEKMKRFKF
ncbi:MAG: DEAD/DEAH box helicase [Candidatus Aenigmarchaeota archaeon]|nr:DEAD/DEAH box helicase [Candidatus Aenigmarchaeota archaeon]